MSQAWRTSYASDPTLLASVHKVSRSRRSKLSVQGGVEGCCTAAARLSPSWAAVCGQALALLRFRRHQQCVRWCVLQPAPCSAEWHCCAAAIDMPARDRLQGAPSAAATPVADTHGAAPRVPATGAKAPRSQGTTATAPVLVSVCVSSQSRGVGCRARLWLTSPRMSHRGQVTRVCRQRSCTIQSLTHWAHSALIVTHFANLERMHYQILHLKRHSLAQRSPQFIFRSSGNRKYVM